MKKILCICFVLFCLVGCKDKDYSGTYFNKNNPEMIGTVEKISDFYTVKLPYLDSLMGKRTFIGDIKIEDKNVVKDGLIMGFVDDNDNIHINSNIFIKN